MNIAETILREIEAEAAATRRVLEAVPADKMGWKPHEKSMTLGRLAGHIAETPSWMPGMAQQDEIDFATADYTPFDAASGDLLETFDRSLEICRESLRGLSDEDMQTTWTGRSGDKVVMQMPRAVVIKSMVINHVIHHRGQLTVYLRLLDVPVPSTYGPTADASGF